MILTLTVFSTFCALNAVQEKLCRIFSKTKLRSTLYEKALDSSGIPNPIRK